jgi:hypothetical protein
MRKVERTEVRKVVSPKMKVLKAPLKEKHSVGRPTKYLSEYAIRVTRLCLSGATDLQIAEYFNVSESTLNLWKTKHKDFSESIRRSKLEADMQVAVALFKRAKSGDLRACIFWLRNRCPHLWNRANRIELTGEEVKRSPPPVINIIQPKPE